MSLTRNPAGRIHAASCRCRPCRAAQRRPLASFWREARLAVVILASVALASWTVGAIALWFGSAAQ